MDLNPGGIISWLVVGLIAGWIASQLVGNQRTGCIINIILGVVGAFVGGLIMSAIGVEGTSGFLQTLAVAILGALVLLILARIAGAR